MFQITFIATKKHSLPKREADFCKSTRYNPEASHEFTGLLYHTILLISIVKCLVFSHSFHITLKEFESLFNTVKGQSFVRSVSAKQKSCIYNKRSKTVNVIAYIFIV